MEGIMAPQMDTLPRSTSLLLGLLSKWRAGVPDSLSTEDPLVLLRVLDCVDATDGISQADLNWKLGLNQSRLSKLLKKMIREGWLEQAHDHYDRRLQMLRSTSSGREVLYFLESNLSIQAQRDICWSNVPITDAPEIFGVIV